MTGTAFEVGALIAQGKPVFGYLNVEESLAERVAQHFTTGLRCDAERNIRFDPDGLVRRRLRFAGEPDAGLWDRRVGRHHRAPARSATKTAIGTSSGSSAAPRRWGVC